MSFLWPNRIWIYRLPAGCGGEGVQGYGGESIDKEVLVAGGELGLRANVQAKGNGGTNPNALPGDIRMAQWKIYAPKGEILPGAVKQHDIIRDDLGRRFGVTSDYVPGLGANIICDRLEV